MPKPAASAGRKESQKPSTFATPSASTVSSTTRGGSSSTAAASGSTVGGGGGIGGKRKTNNSSQDVPKIEDEAMAALLEPVEYGRRQSKRICVARNRFLYNMF